MAAYTTSVAVQPPADIDSRFIHLTIHGALTIRDGYAWDGPSGPTIDTPTFMRASLVHDALYQLMRSGLLPGRWRRVADEEMRRICREDCMSRFRAWYVYRAVRRAAGPAADPQNQKKVKWAPRRSCKK